jgi:hypothetical protein
MPDLRRRALVVVGVFHDEGAWFGSMKLELWHVLEKAGAVVWRRASSQLSFIKYNMLLCI